MGKFIISYLGKKILNDRMGGGAEIVLLNSPRKYNGGKEIIKFFRAGNQNDQPPPPHKQTKYTPNCT